MWRSESLSNYFCAFCFWVTFVVTYVVFFNTCVAMVVDIVRTELFSWILFFEYTSFWLRVLVSDMSFESVSIETDVRFFMIFVGDWIWKTYDLRHDTCPCWCIFLVKNFVFSIYHLFHIVLIISIWSEIKSRNDIANIILIQFTIIPKYYYHHFINVFWGKREPHPLQICILRTYCIFFDDFNAANQ